MGGAASVKVNAAKNVNDKMLEEMLHDKAKMKDLWKKLDFNGNNLVSLAEIDKMIVSIPGFQKFNNKPAMMRAYKKTCYGDGDGDAYVEKKEFAALLMNIYYFDKLWKVFDDIDTGDDRRVDHGEFKAGCAKIGVELTDEEAAREFGKMDKNGGGQVLFDEFCKYVAKMAMGGAIVTLADSKPAGTKRQALKTSRITMGGDLGGASGAARPKAAPKKKAPAKKVDPSLLPAFLNAAHSVEDKALNEALTNPAKLAEMWKGLDFNGNGICSLAEIDKMIVGFAGFEHFNNKPALMRAYKKTCHASGGGDGDDWVEKKEFPALLRNIYYFNKLWNVFDDVDTGDDRRVDIHEFMAGLDKMGVKLTETQGLNAFLSMDKNGGGQVLFEEFCCFFGKMAVGKLPDLDRALPGRGPKVPALASGRPMASESGGGRSGGIGGRLHQKQAHQYRDPDRFKKARGKQEAALAPYEGPKIVTITNKD